MSYFTTIHCSVCGSALTNAHCNRCLLDLAENAPNVTATASEFGEYEIEGEIARGGMGIVYRAWHKPSSRRVALKLLLDGELSTPQQVRRFYTEAAAAAMLQHPNIVRVDEFGECDAQHYIAMELIEGGCLSTAAITNAMDIAGVIAKIARAVAFAHEHGVLHCDLKPSNILIDQAREPCLADFGLAKIDSQEQLFRDCEDLGGTPSYAAPEQVIKGDVSAAADVYGLGAVLYHMLSGRPPFMGGTATETLRHVIDETPAELAASVPCDLATICFKCLDKVPSARYASSLEVAEECERFLRGEVIKARPVSWKII